MYCNNVPSPTKPGAEVGGFLPEIRGMATPYHAIISKMIEEHEYGMF